MAFCSDSSAPGTDGALFSDERVHTTPPSSPPPPMAKPNAFSVLGKRKALASIAHNAATKKTKPIPSTCSSSSTSTLTQLQISLGQTVQKKCPGCGMSYIISSTEDRKLHDKFHKQTTQGYDVGKTFLPGLAKHSPLSVRKITHNNTTTGPARLEDDTICRIAPSSSTIHQRRRAKDVLRIVQTHLGAVEIPETLLDQTVPERYTSYLYLRGTKCIGYLLAEDIVKAYTVVEPDRIAFPGSGTTTMTTDTSSRSRNGSAASALAALKAKRQAALQEEERLPLQLSQAKSSAVLGISRIWTAPEYRGQKVAQEMLREALGDATRLVNARLAYIKNKREAARNGQVITAALDGKEKGWTRDHLQAAMDAARGGNVKSMIAFSQPTVAGTRLAKKWFGRRYGWLVYVD